MRGRTLVWIAAVVMLVPWGIVAWSIMRGDLAHASGALQFAWVAGISWLMWATGQLALTASKVAKLEHEQTEPVDDHDVTTGGRHVR